MLDRRLLVLVKLAVAVLSKTRLSAAVGRRPATTPPLEMLAQLSAFQLGPAEPTQNRLAGTTRSSRCSSCRADRFRPAGRESFGEAWRAFRGLDGTMG